MSVNLTLSLRLLPSGQTIEDLTVDSNPDSTLSQFVEECLIELERDMQVQLQDREVLVDPQDFKVFTVERENSCQLDLYELVGELPCVKQHLEDGTKLTLCLQSSIFQSMEDIVRENHARRSNSLGGEGITPNPPKRSSSLNAKSPACEDSIKFMAGRREYNRLRRVYSPSSLTLLSEGNQDIITEDIVEQLFSQSRALGASDDTSSVGSAMTELSAVSSLSRPSSARPPTRRKELDRASISSAPLQSYAAATDGISNAGSIFMSVSTSCHESLNEEEEAALVATTQSPVQSPTLAQNESSNLAVPNPASLGVSPPGGGRSIPPSLRSKFTDRKAKFSSSRRTMLKTGSTGASNAGGASVFLTSEAPGGEEGGKLSRNQRTIYDQRSHRESSLAFSKVYEKIKTFEVDFEFAEDDFMVSMEVRGDYTVGQVKENLRSVLKEQGVEATEDIEFLWDPEKYTFTYKHREDTYELYDEQQIFQTTNFVNLWRRENCHLIVEPKRMESKEEKTMNMEIGILIGIGLYQLQFANNDELDITRRKMVSVQRNAVKSRDSLLYCMETELYFQTIPAHVLEQIKDDKILIRVHFTVKSFQTLRVDRSTLADDLVPMAIPDTEMKKKMLGIPLDCDPSDYVLKVVGQESYIHGNYEIIQFAPIIRCLGKREDIRLFLIKKLDHRKDFPRDIPDCNLIDDSTGLTGTHSDLSILSKEDHTQIFTMSMWDVLRNFRVRVVGLDNMRRTGTECDVVYVQAAIFHGGQQLLAQRRTTEVRVVAYPRWNQWLVFDIAVKNLPKAARLCVGVYGGTKQRVSKKRRPSVKEDKRGEGVNDKLLHWVNMQILDHRALLRQGLLRLNLWPIGQASADEIPVGSTAVNPDGNNSVALYIELDTYAHPVACPTSGWEEDVQFVPMDSAPPIFMKDLKKSIAADPLSPLDKAQKELIWKFRKHCSTIPEALPKLLQCVNWASLEDVCEIHRLLKIWMPIPTSVALELLDYHFADEKVRTLAVRRLEKLSNEELICYLLQLIQVLKFEPYHDSALARFLLKRALHSKRIGHFFYWYLRSEMDTPEFCQRFGILLEAYLRGCGEMMFKEIQRQHTAVCHIMKVASDLKKYLDRHGNKGVTEYVKEQLEKYDLPESFSPPYDPFVKLGRLNISKSRVMDSKKTPLWLEFENSDHTAISERPIKVIAKNGDDLRQDMLTLQMLSLMDKLWQANGLDLFIIPYGCMSTGHNMGMIQVVQDAETVAKIQRDHGGSFSALKEEPIHDWLKKKNMQSRFDAVVERFTLSCAGYCVATYILGIGDRHNDNIMVTTSGNLLHIDFGHFLGNTKAFLGMNRERAPFVLTPDFIYVMGKKDSENFKKFEETAVKAYLIIRKSANVFINLFSMMKCTGIPELQSVKDIEYLRSVLVLGKSEKMAEEHFKQQIQKCLKVSWSTQLNWLGHNIAHIRS